MGAVILTTAVFAAVSMTTALVMSRVTGSIPFALVLGLAWGVAILNLDRLLVMGLGSENSKKRLFMLAMPRIILALIIGVVISTPLTLTIFQSEIQAKLAETNLALQSEREAQLVNSPINESLKTAEDELVTLQSIIHRGAVPDVTANPKYEEAQRQLDAAKADHQVKLDKFHQDEAAYIQESDGSGGTGVAGCADECLRKKAVADNSGVTAGRAQAEVDRRQAELDTIAGQLEDGALEASQRQVEDAVATLPAAQAKVDGLKEQVAAFRSLTYDTSSANTGLLARLQALEEVSKDSAMATIAHLAVALLFMSIELLPVLFKVLTNMGKKGLYEEILEMEEKAQLGSAELASGRSASVRNARIEAEEEAEKLRIALQLQVVQSANERIISRQADAIERALDDWEAGGGAALVGAMAAAEAAAPSSSSSHPAGSGMSDTQSNGATFVWPSATVSAASESADVRVPGLVDPRELS